MDSASPYHHLLFRTAAHVDERGTLFVTEAGAACQVPFSVQRVFWLTGVPAGARRGMHAHQTCWEALVAVHGSFCVRLDDGVNPPETFTLERADQGLLIPPMVWCELFDFSADAVCLCLASGAYEPGGYINDHTVFKQRVSVWKERESV